MYSGLGVTIGAVNSVALTVLGQPRAGDPSVLSVPTELHLPEGGAFVLGAGTPAPGAQVFSGYAARVGDPVGILADDGSTYLGEDLVASTVACLQYRTGTSDVPTMLAHPAAWSAHTVEALQAALVRAGVTARTIPEPIAAVRWLDATHGPLGDDVTVVYDLGARSLDVTVVQGGAHPMLLGRPLSSDDVSGDHFDHLVTTYLLETLGGDSTGLDPFDSATVAALADFRGRCRAAKEALSSDTETVVPVALPGLHRDLRLVRSEFEELAREPLGASLAVVQDAIRGAGLDRADIGRVLLIGGGSSTPLVAELISSELGLPIVSSARPAFTAAHGAALAAAADGAPTAAVPMTPPAPVVDDEPETVALPVVPAAEAPPVAAAHRPAVVDTGSGTPSRARARSFALVGAAVAAVVVLAGGGLAIGTLSSEAETPGSEVGPSSEVVAGHSTTTATVPGTTVPGTTGAQPSEAGTTVPIGVQGPDGTVTAVPVAATPASGAAPTGAVPAPDLTAPAPVAPGQSPQAPQPAPQPAPAPAPAPAPQPAPQPTPPSTGGSGVGDALSGAGQGAGAVVEGVGNGVGGVLDGTGNVVGGVLDGTGQVVGGLLGTGR
ncbi:Hsp70 family protein [Rhodococcus pyridinivorans]|uniref:Hsp70 family protein n=1 Tax=Rhodococcus pyridinivorans TaxID=103816 RepID=UPI00280B3F4C|nr:Hsp70 family protein [Rhodococcus pyridinivorans]WMM71960.1 Hsp70 family protein [Rhodococcus pyridinivorans]